MRATQGGINTSAEIHALLNLHPLDPARSFDILRSRPPDIPESLNLIDCVDTDDLALFSEPHDHTLRGTLRRFLCNYARLTPQEAALLSYHTTWPC